MSARRQATALGLTHFLTAFALAANAAVVDRGPYLQQGTESSVIVKWRTDVASDSVVRYGSTAANLDQSATATFVGTDHMVQLTGLAAATKYFYSVGDSDGSIAGDSSYFFLTSPAADAEPPTRIWVIGDSGTANADARTVRDAYKSYTSARGTELWLMLGDNAYPDGTQSEYQAAVFDTYPELLRQTPLWPTLGNHDGHTADSASQSGPYYDIFSLPTAAELGGVASGTEAYYSFEYANIHFVVLDSYETDRSNDGAMLTWLENDLALQLKDWLIAFWHHPPYSKGSHDSDMDGRLIDMRQNALPILEAYGVDLVLTGHSHSYERSFLLNGHYGDSDSLVASMVVDRGDGRDGGDGAYAKAAGIAVADQGAVYAVAGSSGKIGGGSLDHEAMYISLNELGSMVLDVEGPRLDAVFLNASGEIADSFSIDKGDGVDATPPDLVEARASAATTVELRFSEAVESASAQLAGNYAIDQGVSVMAASLALNNRRVTLTTSVMTPGHTYTVTVNDVKDVVGNVIATDTSRSFTYSVSATLSFQNGAHPDAGYAGMDDTYLSFASQSGNFGGSATLQLDGDDPPGSGGDLVTLMRWDVSNTPADSTVTAAAITINVSNASDNGYEIYQALREWQEDAANWTMATSVTSWTRPGAEGAGDRGDSVLGTIAAASAGTYTVALDPAGIATVQSWVDGSAPNHGLVISNSSSTNGLDFASSESGDATTRPRLTVAHILAPPPGDADGDGIADDADNCIDVANPNQVDSNGDGYGNYCDADLNDDCSINAIDLGILKSVFFQLSPDADFNSDGIVNVLDLGFLKGSFFAVPGPSGLTTVCSRR